MLTRPAVTRPRPLGQGQRQCKATVRASKPPNETKNSATAEKARDPDKTAIQGDSRSFVVVPINAVYITSYQYSVVT